MVGQQLTPVALVVLGKAGVSLRSVASAVRLCCLVLVVGPERSNVGVQASQFGLFGKRCLADHLVHLEAGYLRMLLDEKICCGQK